MKSTKPTYRELIGKWVMFETTERYHGGDGTQMPLEYLSGIEIQAGDRIRYQGEAGRVEFVATADGETAWYLEECGVGCMLAVPSFGLVYTRPDEDLEFVGRDGGHDSG
jgi:hypothetical protein